MRTDDPRAGFSLPEQMVILVVMAITVAASVPPFMSVLRASRIEAAVTEIAVSMRAARAKAISQGNDFVWSYEAATTTYGAFDDDNGNGGRDTGEVVYGPSLVDAGIALVSSTIASNRIIFRSLGNASAGGVMEFSDSRGALLRITIEAATGMISVSNHVAAPESP